VNILPSKLSQVYSYVHPVLLLSLCAVRFEKLVADPAQELLADLPWLALLQISYVMFCLPPAGSAQTTEAVSEGEEKKKAAPRSPSSPSVTLRPGKPGYRRKHQSGKLDLAGALAKLMPAFLSLAISSLIATPILAVLLVLFGAPLTTHNLETVLCAAHMALLSATALVYTHGLEAHVWNEIWGIARPADTVWGSALGTGLGAWLGAIPIPLDWDRPWQAFPITILVGAYIGHALGSLVSRTPLLYGKRIQFAPVETEGAEKKTN
jgi:phosphatidylinositol glycan class F